MERAKELLSNRIIRVHGKTYSNDYYLLFLPSDCVRNMLDMNKKKKEK